MSETTTTCEHGQLARVCQLCEQGVEIERLNFKATRWIADLSRLIAEIAKLRHELVFLGASAHVDNTEINRLTAENEDLRAWKAAAERHAEDATEYVVALQNAGLRAENAALRERLKPADEVDWRTELRLKHQVSMARKPPISLADLDWADYRGRT